MFTSLSEWMSDTDYEWRQRLEPVRLVIETDFSADGVREAQSKYGVAARLLLNKGWPHSKIIKRYPALTLVILVGNAALAYDQGAYWQSFWDELGVARDADFENEIRSWQISRDGSPHVGLGLYPDNTFNYVRVLQVIGSPGEIDRTRIEIFACLK